MDVDWTRRAACRGTDPEIFFPAGDLAGRRTQEKARWVAHTYCARCPVLRQCNQRAERTVSEGLWAGAWRAWGVEPTPLIAAAYDELRAS